MKKTIAMLAVLLTVTAAGRAQEQEPVQEQFQKQEQFQEQVLNNVTVEKADSAYIQGDFLTAISMYENIIASQGVNATLYMNLGNAWFQQDELAKAILNYERAYLLDPSDEDIVFNLELARTRTVDKVNPKNELFISVWFRSLMNTLDLRQWSILTILFFVIAIALVGIMILSKKIGIRKISFGLSVLFLFVSILSFIFASTQKGNISHRDTAIVMAASVTVKSTPIETGTDLFTLHEGRKVEIIDSSMKDWVEIRLEDGDTGWMPVSAMEVI